MRIKELFKQMDEGFSPILYHATSLNAIDSIINSNEIRLSKYPLKDGVFYMSFARSRTGEFIEYLRSLSDMELDEEGFNPREEFCVLEMDGRSLGHNYSGSPFSAFHPQDGEVFGDEDEYEIDFDFMEDRLWSRSITLPNAKKYIRRIHFVNVSEEWDGHIEQTQRQLSIPVSFYVDVRSFMQGKEITPTSA